MFIDINPQKDSLEGRLRRDAVRETMQLFDSAESQEISSAAEAITIDDDFDDAIDKALLDLLED